MTCMLALIHACPGLVNTYPVKSFNLNDAAAPIFFEPAYSSQIGVLDANAGYGVATSDGGFVLVGGGAETEAFVHNSAFAVKMSSTGSVLWNWVSTNLNAKDTAIGCTQIPGGGDILVVGYRSVGGVVKRSLTRLGLTNGIEVWTATDFGDAAGAHGAWENIDVTADGGAVLLSGWMAKPDTTEMGYRSGGNTFGGQAVVMQIPVTALGATAPTSASASWTRVWAQHNAAHAARSLPSGEVAVLLWTETDPDSSQGPSSGSAAVAKLNANGAIVWGSINYGETNKIEGTDLQVSKDGSQLVFVGHGKCSATSSALCGKAMGVTASGGAVVWTSEFGSCGVPNQCGTTLILNECWGLQALSDGYAIACGTGIEGCGGLTGQTLTDCNTGRADKRAGAYARNPSVWQAMTVKVGLSGALQWLRTDAYRRPGEAGVGEPGFLNPQTSSAAEYVMLAQDGGIVVTTDQTDGIALLRLQAQTPRVTCMPQDSFIHVSFDVARLIRSNLGGQGGRCETAGYCVEPYDASTTPHDILFETIGVSRQGEPIDLRVTNRSEYRAWRTRLNGIKSQTEGDKTGFFGVINLLGPRSTSQFTPGGTWSTEFTHVELKFEFLGRWTKAPITLDKTFMTFYDFDTGRPTFDGSSTQVEIMQVGPESSAIYLAPSTEVQQYDTWQSYLQPSAYSAFMGSNPAPWSSKINVASTYGIGNDNPFSPHQLTALQAARSVMAQFISVNSFHCGHSSQRARRLVEHTQLGPAAIRYLIMGGRTAFHEQGYTPRMEHHSFHGYHDEL